MANNSHKHFDLDDLFIEKGDQKDPVSINFNRRPRNRKHTRRDHGGRPLAFGAQLRRNFGLEGV